jgi:ABC-type antimicrobial peptide transport system permease subunit
MAKISLTPGRTVSAGSIVGLIFLLLFGIGFAIVVGNVLAENDAPPIFSFLFFILIVAWIGTVLFMIVCHVKNLNRARGLSLIDINTEQKTNNEIKRSPMQSLRELELLKRDGLITEIEYQQKRAQLMDERW